jgi:hypothetical protein
MCNTLQCTPMYRSFAERGGRAQGSARVRDLCLAQAHRCEQARQQARLLACHCSRDVDACGSIDQPEQAGRMIGALRGAEHQVTARVERIVKSAADLLLQLPIQVDEHVAAGDEIDVRERRVLEQVVRGEQHDVAQLLPDAV